jgi:hypothetical protein
VLPPAEPPRVVTVGKTMVENASPIDDDDLELDLSKKSHLFARANFVEVKIFCYRATFFWTQMNFS